MSAESKRYHQIRRAILRRLLVRMKEMRAGKETRAEASDTLAMEPRKTGRTAVWTSEPERREKETQQRLNG
jgi:hypothetical protein